MNLRFGLISMLVAGALLSVVGTNEAVGQNSIINNETNAQLLSFRAKAARNRRVKSSDDKRLDRRQNIGSALGTTTKEAACGGVAIGNVRPTIGVTGPRETTVIILGNVINTNNDC